VPTSRAKSSSVGPQTYGFAATAASLAARAVTRLTRASFHTTTIAATGAEVFAFASVAVTTLTTVVKWENPKITTKTVVDLGPFERRRRWVLVAY
jgi:hypothetical protein